MTASYSQTDQKTDDVVATLLKLPVRNLESRIRELENEIQYREDLNEELLLGLGTNRLRLEDRRWHLRYGGVLSVDSKEKQHVERELQQVEKRESSEMLDCFRDVSALKHRLQEARETFEINKGKVKLIEGL